MKLLFILLLGLGFSQTELTTRVYEYQMNWDGTYYEELDFWAITGHQLDFAIISLASFASKLPPKNCSNDIELTFPSADKGSDAELTNMSK